jgi:hypothetical protein
MRCEYEAVLEAVQRRLDANPYAMRTRRQTVEPCLGHSRLDGSDPIPDASAEKPGDRNGPASPCLPSEEGAGYPRNRTAPHRPTGASGISIRKEPAFCV